MTVGVHDVEEADNVAVVHLLEEGNLADGSRGHTFVFGFEPDLLQGDDSVVFGSEVFGLVDNTVRS